ncbi:MAG: hypothetical protein JRI68_34060, partial [Deltaproteobacteria bacterium]|nr:hypothetical protein [Deltaproteobacteria bacterium]
VATFLVAAFLVATFLVAAFLVVAFLVVDCRALVLLLAVVRFEVFDPALLWLRAVFPVEACLAFVTMLVTLQIPRE